MGASPGVPVGGPGQRARAEGRTPGASAARGEKFPTLEREAEKFRPRGAAPKARPTLPPRGRGAALQPVASLGSAATLWGYTLRLGAGEPGLRKGQEEEMQ